MFKRNVKAISYAALLLLGLSLISAGARRAAARRAAPLAGQIETLSAEPVGDYMLQQSDGHVVCRDATVAETEFVTARDERVSLYVISPMRQDGITPQSAGLTIILRGTPQLENFPQAKQAFLRAATTWENLIRSPITMIIDVDFGPTRFGIPYPDPDILGSTSPQSVGGSAIYPEVRSRLLAQASSPREAALYNALPAATIPTDIGTTAGMFAPSALFRALGLLNAVADPTTETANLGPPPSIGFNSSFAFDFDPSNGIDANKTDFDAVAVHEIGHALGFSSTAGNLELNPRDNLRSAILDLFRLRPGVTNFSTALRIQSSGGPQIFFAGTTELSLSTGRPDGSGGDGNQASHWKDDALTGQYLGIMDPVINLGTRYTITDNDLLAFDSFGYEVSPPGSGDETIALTAGTAQAGSISAPASGAALLGSTQYSILVPQGAAQLTIDLSGNQDVDLFARFGQRITIASSGPIADLKSDSPAGTETITVTPATNPVLRAGTYFIAVANYGPGAASFTVKATVTGGGGNRPPVVNSLQANLDGDTLTLTGLAADPDGDIAQAQTNLLDATGQVVGQTQPFDVSFGSATTVNFTLSITNLNALPAALQAALIFIDRRGNRSAAVTADFSQGDAGGPTLAGASYNGKKLTIKGGGFANQVLIEINGRVAGIFPSATKKKIKLKGSAAQLNLRAGFNRLRVLNGDLRSNLFVLDF